MVSYNPKFVENIMSTSAVSFTKPLYYISKIKESMVDDDIFTLFTYKEKKLKRLIDRKKATDLGTLFPNF